MTTITVEQKQKANELRKEGKIKEALSIYEALWKEAEDKFIGAGLLHCLRKMELFEKAILFADGLIAKYPDFEWCKNEVIWTYIHGILEKVKDDEPLENILEIAQKIMSLNPDGLAAKKVVFKVLKTAKALNNWKTVDEWVAKISPDTLSTNPMTNSLGREGWSDQSLWYNYKIRSLIEKGQPNEALILIDQISECFPKQKKFFLRLEGLAYYQLKNLAEAKKVYQKLCSNHKPDWWLLHEYAKVVRDKGQREEALKIMYQAANNHPKLEAMVTLFVDIGNLCKEIGKNEAARAHLALCKFVRDEQGWSIPYSIISTIAEVNKLIGNNNEPTSLKEALILCRGEWKKVTGKNEKLSLQKGRKLRRELTGRINLGKPDQPFCFIIGKDNESFFCFKSDLPQGLKDGDEVIFNAIPSFDKKKNKESWKAVDIRKG